MMMNFAVFGSYSALMTVFPLHAVSVLGDGGSASAVGLLFAAAACFGFIGAPLGGILADKIGRKKTVVPAGVLIAVGVGSLQCDVNYCPGKILYIICKPGLRVTNLSTAQTC